MLMNFINRSKYTTWVLMPVIVGLLLTGVPPVTKAHAATYPIANSADAKTWGLDSLGNLMRSGKFNSGKNVQKLFLNSTFKVPLPSNLMSFVADRGAALALGKALFWDMQVGSDGIQACATCHFQAGGDVRAKNQVSTQGNQVRYQRDGDIIGFYNAAKTDPADTFEQIGDRLWEPNFLLTGEDFPLVITQNAFLPSSPESGDTVAADTGEKNRNDVVGSMGLMAGKFVSVTPGSPVDLYEAGTLGTMRQTTGRNAPPSVNGVFNLFQFWDGRAHPKFNGANPIGPLDTSSPKYFINSKGKLQERVLNLNVASLASQSVGPPLSDVEMSFAGRIWPDIGKKLTRDGAMIPLAYQEVSATDSVLAPYRNITGKGLTKTYKELVQAAFKDNLWNIPLGIQSIKFSNAKLKRTTVDELIYIQGPPEISARSTAAQAASKPLPEGYSQMEANFPLFWGIAIMLYEAELVSEQSRFDKWMEGTGTLTTEELDGLNVFVNAGKCIACHSGPEFTNATVRNTQNGAEQIEPIRKTNGDPAFYDNGFYNVGMTPTVDDIQRGAGNGTFPWGNSRQFLFEKNEIMDIPFSIMGLPIKGLTAVTNVDTNEHELWKVFFDLETGLETDRILVCIDLNNNGVCDLTDDIKIQTLDIDGNCKASSVRNVELNGPYFHNGGAATLQQILDNYDIGGKFRKDILNKVDMLPDITRLNLASAETPNGTNAEVALVAFMLALTDDRVKTEKKLFDHPQLFIPVDGEATMLDVISGNPAGYHAWLVTQAQAGLFENDPATGAGGLPALGLPDLKPFLNLDHFDGDTGKGGIEEANEGT